MRASATKHLYIVIRYSVLLNERGKWWRLVRKHQGKGGVPTGGYEKELFSDERMIHHQSMFAQITLPGLSCLPRENATVGVFTSDRLPKKWLAGISELISEFDNMEVVTLPPVSRFSEHVSDWINQKIRQADRGGDVIFATVYLDDDDAIAVDYIDALTPYLDNAFIGMVVSFPSGMRGFWDGSSFTEVTQTYRPMTAIGLAHVNKYNCKTQNLEEGESIFTVGSHQSLDRYFPVILDARKDMFIRTVHAKQDTIPTSILQKVWRQIQRYAETPVPSEAVLERFKLASDLVPKTTKDRRPRLQEVCKKLWKPGGQ